MTVQRWRGCVRQCCNHVAWSIGAFVLRVVVMVALGLLLVFGIQLALYLYHHRTTETAAYLDRIATSTHPVISIPSVHHAPQCHTRADVMALVAVLVRIPVNQNPMKEHVQFQLLEARRVDLYTRIMSPRAGAPSADDIAEYKTLVATLKERLGEWTEHRRQRTLLLNALTGCIQSLRDPALRKAIGHEVTALLGMDPMHASVDTMACVDGQCDRPVF